MKNRFKIIGTIPIAFALCACQPKSFTTKAQSTTTAAALEAPTVPVRAVLPLKITAPRLEVFKSKRVMRLFDGEVLLREYRTALGSNPTAIKRAEGDRATPEGTYYIANKNPRSHYFKSLAVSYPNVNDAEIALAAGRIGQHDFESIVKANQNQRLPPQKTAMGGDIMIHGRGSSKDWTWGCMALDDADMLEVFNAIPAHTPIIIHP